MTENFEEINNAKGYFISDKGKVIHNGKVIQPFMHDNYLHVIIKKHVIPVHYLVVLYHYPLPHFDIDVSQIKFKDGDVHNLHVTNLAPKVPSPYKGIYWNSAYWVLMMSIKGKQWYIAHSSDVEELRQIGNLVCSQLGKKLLYPIRESDEVTPSIKKKVRRFFEKAP